MRCLPLLPCVVLACSMCVAATVLSGAEKKFATSAVCSQVDKAYRRQKNADGTLKPEYYAVSYGGTADGTTTDQSIDRVKLSDFAELLQKHLREQKYLLAPDAKSADLLLHVKWGKTLSYNSINYGMAVTQAAKSMNMISGVTGANTQEMASLANDAGGEIEGDLMALMMENRARDQATEGAARLLGYIDEVNDVNDIRRWAGGGHFYDDLRDDVEEARYYIVVFAYDFRALAERKQQQVRWITRISIRAQGNSFDSNMAAMIERAGRFFGRDSDGLVRRFEGTVEMGETEVLGVVEEEPSATAEGQPTP